MSTGNEGNLEMGRLRRRAQVPRLDTANLGSTRGAPEPWLPPNVEWPTLRGERMPLLVQVPLRLLAGHETDNGLLQVFFHDPVWYDAENGPRPWYDSFEPWMPTAHVRIVPEPPAPDIVFAGRRPRAFESFDMLPDAETLEALGIRVTPEVEEQLDAEQDTFDALSFLGGWPRWLQGEQYPHCPRSGLPCRFLLQLASEAFGGDGVAYVFQSPAHPELLTLLWQR